MTRVTGKEGQGECKRCRVEGQEGYYCKEHAEEVEKNADRATIAQ